MPAYFTDCPPAFFAVDVLIPPALPATATCLPAACRDKYALPMSPAQREYAF